MSDFHTLLKTRAEHIEDVLSALLNDTVGSHETVRPPKLVEAMRYSALDGGKRIRPFLLMESAAMFGVAPEQSARAAAALECIHCYSLVHDDLPAMDDDDLRRGKPTLHKAFNEATAILAGDGLLTIAFDILADEQTHIDGTIRAKLVQLYAQNAGIGGMVGGQMFDLEAETKPLNEDDILTLQTMKTGALIRCACEAGALIGGATSKEQTHLLEFGRIVGQAFQLVDDILDVTSDAKTMGKATAKDANAGKGTLVALYGLEASQQHAKKLLDQAIMELSIFGGRAKNLSEAARFTIERKN